jgi:indolepyruvate ferredoxin oxidoreductase
MAEVSSIPSPMWDRYLRAHGRVHLTGLEALVRIGLDQVRRDRAAGHCVGAFYSGYPGSPLAGLDQLLTSLRPVLDPEHVRFVPGLNEELAASAVAGTQMLDLFPHARYDGVVGLWFGKAPGLDRALDAIRHANYQGISRLGGAVALVGDDPACKSSTLPSHSEYALAHAVMPVLYPADAGEIVELGRHAFALSRYAGLWVALKIVADVADGGMILDLPREREPELPKLEIEGRPFRKRLDPRLLPPAVHRIEEELFYERLEAVRRYAEINGLNPIERTHRNDRIGLVSTGRLYRELETALELLGLDDAALERLGVRLMRVQLVYPLEPRRLSEFAHGLDEIVVIDERRGFLEDQLRATLFNEVDRPRVLGQRDARGAPWLARHADISAATLALDLAPHLIELLGARELAPRVERLRALRETESPLSVLSRQPHFCSGCPHSTSTQVPEGARAGGGIGCHTLALNMDRAVEFVGAMGSEGAPWIGLSGYTETPHLFQNLGDGTYCHSGRLAVRAAVEARVSLTYKLLYNGSIAMTGGQQAVGMKPVSEIAQDLLRDGVAQVTAVTHDPALVALAERDARVSIVDREEYGNAMRALARTPGVTCLIYDQLCANQKQKLEKRGALEPARERIWIDQDVCEGCGDCGKKTSCLSLWPVETALGRKTRLHTASCTDDRACLVGDCPAFVSAELPPPLRGAREELVALALPEPACASLGDGRYEIHFVGIGSTGVVTVNALVVRAAEIEGLHARHLDQTGLSQRGGKVVSHCILSRTPLCGSARVSAGAADAFFALDALGAADPAELALLDVQRSRVALHDCMSPTSQMVANPGLAAPDIDAIAGLLGPRSRSLARVRAEDLAQAVLGQSLGANVVMLGAALQLGMLPLPLAAVECAIRDRGIAVESNLLALRLGRAAIAAPEQAARWLAELHPPSIGDGGDPTRAAALLGEAWEVFSRALDASPASDARELLRTRVAGFALDLVSYQNEPYAKRYLERLARVARAEAAVAAGAPALCAAVARELYRAMAYKDEYEVARLLLRGPFRRWLDRRSGGRARVGYHLHPPLLRSLGLRRKLRLGRGADLLFAALASMRSLRGTPLDPFGYLSERRAERAYLAWYEDVVDRLVSRLSREKHAAAVAIAAAPSGVRGFSGVKASAELRVRAAIEDQLRAL